MKSLSHVRLFVTPWTAAYQAPPSMGFSRQEYWSGVPLPSPGTLCNSLLSFPYLLWSHPNDLRPTHWLTDQLEQTARTQPGCTWGWACSRCGGALSLSEAWEAGTVLSSPSCSSICCSSVTTRKQNLFITCLVFSSIYTFCCSMKKSLLSLSHQFSLLQPKEKSFEKLQNPAGSHSAERQRRKKTEL